MSTTEDRLVAALSARADLVQPEHLRPDEAPSPRRQRWPRTATYVVAAAAAVATVALLPVVLDPPADDDHERPTPGPASGGPAWPVFREDSFDVDGDGVADPVRIRDPRPGRAGDMLVEVEPSTGGDQVETRMRKPDLAYRLGHVDADGDGDEEILVREYMTPQAIRLLDLVDGALRPVAQPSDPLVTNAFTREGRVQHWWIADDTLYSSRSVDVLAESDHYVPLPEQYAVEVWSWRLVDGALVAEDAGPMCVQRDHPEQPFPC
jgi:hypothetical protein